MMGRGVSGSISSIGPNPIQEEEGERGEDVEGVRMCRLPDDGPGVEGKCGVDGEGERRDIIPEDIDDERLCVRRLRGRKFCEEVMSILPPPTTGRLRREDRKELRVCVCSNEVGVVVIISEPVSWTYE